MIGVLTIWEINQKNAWRIDEVQKEVSMGVTARIAGEIKISGFGAYMITDKQSNGFDIVKWEFTPYTAQNDIEQIKQG